jgi:hypothetical protein
MGYEALGIGVGNDLTVLALNSSPVGAVIFDQRDMFSGKKKELLDLCFCLFSPFGRGAFSSLEVIEPPSSEIE